MARDDNKTGTMEQRIHYFETCPSYFFWKSASTTTSVNVTKNVKYVTCDMCKKNILDFVSTLNWELLSAEELKQISSWAKLKK